MCADLFQSTMNMVDRALDDAKMTRNDIDVVVLVGGSTRIPKIEHLLRNKFKEKKICKNFDTAEAVAYGAAVQSAIIHGNASEEMKTIKTVETTSKFFLIFRVT